MVEEGSAGRFRFPRFTISSRIAIVAAASLFWVTACTGTHRVATTDRPAAQPPAPPPVEKPADTPADPVRTAEEDVESTHAVPDVDPVELSAEPLRHEFAIPFARGSAELGPRARAMLDDLSGWIESQAGFCNLEIRAEPRGGGAEAERDLARRRGENVRAYLLLQAPIRAERIRVQMTDAGAAVKTASKSRQAQPVVVAVLPR